MLLGRLDRPQRGVGATSLRRPVFLAFVLLSSAAYITGAIDSIAHGWTFIGAAGRNPSDDLQYLQWATDGAHNGLIANLYGTATAAHVFFHPIWLLTGALHVWAHVPYVVLIGILQFGTATIVVATTERYVNHVLGRSSLFTVALALFATTPLYLLVRVLNPSSTSTGITAVVIRELMPLVQMDGDFSITLTIAGVMWFLMLLGPLFEAEEPMGLLPSLTYGRAWLTGLLGAAVSLLHPWQGITLLAIMVLTVLLRHSNRTAKAAVLPGILTCLPLIYYKVLPYLDASWHAASTGQRQSLLPLSESQHWLAMTAALCLAYALPGMPAWIKKRPTTSDLMVRLWIVGVAVAFLVSPTARLHALDGLSIPIAVLVAESRAVVWASGESRRAARRAARSVWSGFVLLIGLSGPVAYIQLTHYSLNPMASGAALPAADGRALDALAKLPRGYVLTTPELGDWVPVITDDPTWVGHPIWTHDFRQRQRIADHLFASDSSLTPGVARSEVSATTARYVVIPCGSSSWLVPVLVSHEWRASAFGCATLLVNPPGQ